MLYGVLSITGVPTLSYRQLANGRPAQEEEHPYGIDESEAPLMAQVGVEPQVESPVSLEVLLLLHVPLPPVVLPLHNYTFYSYTEINVSAITHCVRLSSTFPITKTMAQAILYVSSTAPAKYPVIDKHYRWIPIHGPEPLTFARLSAIWHDHSPLAVYSSGDDNWGWSALCVTYQVRRRWVHLSSPVDPVDVTPTVFAAVLGRDLDLENPLLSVITTTFKSGDKILRPMRSLQSQAYTNWEWILWDDSPTGDDATYKRLLELQRSDLRIQVYRAPRPSTVIGCMKRRAAGLAQGSYIVEVDHDDDLHADLFRWIVDAGRRFPDAVFFYSDCAEMTEETYEPAGYGDFFAFGYSGHYNTWSDFHGRYVQASYAPAPNPKTLTHIVGVPNHVRVWRRDAYDRVGKHNPELSVADDYELMLRTWLEYPTGWCHIRACGYYQYRNRDGNFTFIRNSLIQHNVAHIHRHYTNRLPPPRSIDGTKPIWATDDADYPATHHVYDPAPYGKAMLIINPTDAATVLTALESADRVIVMGILPDGLSVAAKRRVDWWNLTRPHTTEDAIRFARKFIHRGPAETLIVSM
jgi:glycosyltransferase involved in cell wall biosynthesis